MARPVRNALWAAAQSGFPSARYTKQVALFAPVEYLTYGIRTTLVLLMVVGVDAHIDPAEYVVIRKSAANS